MLTELTDGTADVTLDGSCAETGFSQLHAMIVQRLRSGV